MMKRLDVSVVPCNTLYRQYRFWGPCWPETWWYEKKQHGSSHFLLTAQNQSYTKLSLRQKHNPKPCPNSLFVILIDRERSTAPLCRVNTNSFEFENHPKKLLIYILIKIFSWNKPFKKIYFGKCSKGKNYCKISIDTSRRGKTEEQVARNFNPNRGSNLCSHTRGFAFSRQSFEVENFNVAFAMDKLLNSCPQCREPYSIRCK